uniref:Polymerase PA n=1 Tax=Coleopteran orthomyxo-related virus OKIAV186 TaxID=2746266 RepID=A0A7D7JZN4_9ORTO|nr:polymerase PA [Coleopteran orthomyxo-related virus OKIAV186]
MLLENLGVLDTESQLTIDIIPSVFCDEKMNEAIKDWVQDWEKEIFKEWDLKDIYPFNVKAPTAIRPNILLNKLTDLKEIERKNPIYWKGKILPEGWTNNQIGTWETDEEMVDIVIKEILNALSQDKIDCESTGYKIDPIQFLLEITSLWKGRKDNNFIVVEAEKIKESNVGKALGLGKKKRSLNPQGNEMKQKEGVEIEKLKYDFVFDEILRRFSNNIAGISREEYVYENLLLEPDDCKHPIAIVAEKSATKILKTLLKSNAALYSSKMTNFYSRLGGAYSGGTKEHNRMRRGVSYFPVYGNTSCKGKLSEESFKKHVSGIVVRGPNHARMSTDRIPICTIEILKNNEENLYLVSNIKNKIVVKTNDYIIYSKPNAILKEDTAYLTYTSTSLFSPINLVGLITMEDPCIKQNCNIIEKINRTLKGKEKWLLERFTESVVMAAVGNSRDEGYFASLRKLFMVLLSWKEGDSVANWDINSFCDKTNETLIDNPLSMHFHNTLLDLLSKFKIREDEEES